MLLLQKLIQYIATCVTLAFSIVHVAMYIPSYNYLHSLNIASYSYTENDVIP